jgi:TPR repeat protein
LLIPVLPLQAKLPFLHYLHESASLGEAESQFILGLAYRDGWEGRIKTGSIAAQWCDLAAELGDQRPELVFGLLQQDKVIVTPDPAKAVECLTRAAGQGNDYARVILGEMLLEGNGVPADWPTGVEWIRKSAHAGFFPAQFRLGIIYLVGDSGTPKNEVEALAWFILAAEAGSKPAQQLRDERTQLLGREVATLAIKRSRTLRTNTTPESAGGG